MNGFAVALVFIVGMVFVAIGIKSKDFDIHENFIKNPEKYDEEKLRRFFGIISYAIAACFFLYGIFELASLWIGQIVVFAAAIALFFYFVIKLNFSEKLQNKEYVVNKEQQILEELKAISDELNAGKPEER